MADTKNATAAPAAREPHPRADNLGNRVLGLQRTYGNAAVAEVVQRRGSKAASTDAPGHTKTKGKKAAPADDFAPKGPGEGSSNGYGWLINQGNIYKKSGEDAKAGGRGTGMISFKQAAEYYLGAAWIDPSPMTAQYLMAIYKEMGDSARYDYWVKVMHREIVLAHHKPGEEAVEDMHDKGF